MRPTPLPMMDPPAPVADSRESLIRDVAVALHRSGAPAHRLEGATSALAERLGLEARIFSMPTAVYCSFGPEAAARTVLLRAAPGTLDLGRLAAVDTVVREVIAGRLATSEARARLERALEAPPAHRMAIVVPTMGLTGAVAAILLGGGPAEAAAAGIAGLGVGGLTAVLSRNPRLDPLANLLLAALAALLAGLWTRLVLPADAGLVTVAAIIALVPGLTLTAALTELATRHLVSGTARLADAATSFATLGLGALAGTTLLAAWPAPPPPDLPSPAWLPWALLLPAALCFTVLLQAPLRAFGGILLTSMLGYAAVAGLGPWVPHPLEATAGAFVVALTSNALARWRDTPAAVSLVPGLFLLVPGSVGFRGLTDLLGADLMTGMDHLVGALLTGAALAAGLVVAQVTLPPRRSL
jgi:uncharacterized membrane protein YjjP (DUF1212 family)